MAAAVHMGVLKAALDGMKALQDRVTKEGIPGATKLPLPPSVVPALATLPQLAQLVEGAQGAEPGSSTGPAASDAAPAPAARGNDKPAASLTSSEDATHEAGSTGKGSALAALLPSACLASQAALSKAVAGLLSHRLGHIFQYPVTDDIAPDYSSIVKQPMDLTTMQGRVAGGQVDSWPALVQDLMLMITNALTYNEQGSDVYNIALDFADAALAKVQDVACGRAASKGTAAAEARRAMLVQAQETAAATAATALAVEPTTPSRRGTKRREESAAGRSAKRSRKG
ncbi:BRD8 [Symbiodinium sp. KB8]|nr:BRD8 [Symbiodinium sp. KB8]